MINDNPIYKHIFHPTDLDPENEIAFAHAVRLALAAQTRITQFHAKAQKINPDQDDFPDIRTLLTRWKQLPQDATEDQIWETGIKVSKIKFEASDPVETALFHLEHDPADLVVLATHGTKGLPRWLKTSVAEPLSHGTRAQTLFIPVGSPGFIDIDHGEANLSKVLIPVAKQPSAQPAVDAASKLVKVFGCKDTVFNLLYIGEDEEVPQVETTDLFDWKWEYLTRTGSAVKTITDTAVEISADLLVLATEGQQNLLELFRGSTTDQVVRSSPCPVLSVPVVETGRI